MNKHGKSTLEEDLEYIKSRIAILKEIHYSLILPGDTQELETLMREASLITRTLNRVAAQAHLDLTPEVVQEVHQDPLEDSIMSDTSYKSNIIKGGWSNNTKFSWNDLNPQDAPKSKLREEFDSFERKNTGITESETPTEVEEDDYVPASEIEGQFFIKVLPSTELPALGKHVFIALHNGTFEGGEYTPNTGRFHIRGYRFKIEEVKFWLKPL